MTSVWQKRFGKKTNPQILDFLSCLDADAHLVKYDIAASIAHVRMLGRQHILKHREIKKLVNGLNKIARVYKNGHYQMMIDFEDVHINVENSLNHLIGETAQKLHTARSRNDLVATDLRLYARDAVLSTMVLIINLEDEIIKNAKGNFGLIIPGYTHLQPAQPILWSFYLLTYFFKFQRDFECLKETMKRIDVCPLGSAALAGTTHRIDPEYTAHCLGFKKFSENTLDAIADRDYLCEIMFYFSLLMLHISSLCEDIIIFGSEPFSLLELDERVATGSSIMPQKKNPDVCELLRAKAGLTIGNLVAVLTILKGLSGSYNRDLQEINGIFFHDKDVVQHCLNIVKIVVAGLRPRDSDWAEKENFICATDVVDHLVKSGLPFRKAYNIIAECIKASNGSIDSFMNLCSKETGINQQTVVRLMIPKNSISAKVSKNSTSMFETKKALKRAENFIKRNRSQLIRLQKKHNT